MHNKMKDKGLWGTWKHAYKIPMMEKAENMYAIDWNRMDV